MNKKNLILAIILLVLIGLFYLYQGPFRKWEASMKKPKNFFSGIDVKKVDRIIITKNNIKTTLDKNGDKWKVAGTKDFYVKKEVADGIMKEFSDAMSADIELISVNKDKKSDFNTDNGVSVELYQADKQLLGFTIGKQSSDYSGNYVSQLSGDKTYLIKTLFDNFYSIQDWRDTTIFSSDKNKITKLRFHSPSSDIVIMNNKGGWEVTSPAKFKANKNKITGILDIMANLTAQSIPEQNFKGTGLDKNSLIVEATGDGVNNTLMIGKNNGKNLFYVKKSDSDNIYLISAQQKNALSINLSNIK